MKKLLFFPILFLWFLWGGCYTVAKLDSSRGYSVDRSSAGVNVEFSGVAKTVTNIFGVGHKSNIYLVNNARQYITVCILDKAFDIDPDSAIYDFWNIEFYRSELPVVIHVFSGKDRRSVVKMESGVLPIGRSEDAFWELDKNCRLRRISKPNLSKARKIDVPTIKIESTTLVQFVNPTNSEISVLEVGPIRSDLMKPVSPQTYDGIANTRSVRIKAFSHCSFEIYIPSYDQCGQGVMYWVGGSDHPIVFGVGPNLNQGPKVRQILIK
jgi:hypothetical protein